MEQYINKIINADCMDILKQLPDKCIDLVLTDPPYNVGINYNSYDDNKPYEEYKIWCSQWLKECKRVSKCVLFTCGIVNLSMWYEIEAPYWLYIWYKNNQNSPSKIGGFNIFEPFLIYGKPQKRVGQDGFSMPIAMQKNYEKHPVPKLLKAWEYVINKFTNENDLILDCFSGSGTTAVACHNLNRRFICIEKDEDYYKASVERLLNAQAQQKLF
jgi:DNA modification methylase